MAKANQSAGAREHLDFEHFIASNKYGQYCVPQEFAHRELPRLLADGQVYEPETLAMLEQVYEGGDIVTGGAFIGDFFPMLCGILAEGSRLISFEPHPLTFRAAQETIRLNGLTTIDFTQVAVGAEAGVLPLQISRPNGKSLAAAAKLVENAGYEANQHFEQVDVVRLDDLVPADRAVSILHLDVEGFEERALFGGGDLLRRCRPITVLETTLRRQKKTIERYKGILNELAPGADYDVRHAMENNALFVAENPAVQR